MALKDVFAWASRPDTFPLKFFFLIVALFIACFVVWVVLKEGYETPENIKYLLAKRRGTLATQEGRKGLKAYLDGDDGQGNKSADKATARNTHLSQCYFSTAYMTGCFLPTEGTEYVFSEEAVRLACKGGARAFVLEVWPALDAVGRYRPILQVVEEGSNWRRISMNTMEFELAVQALVDEIYGAKLTSDDQDTQQDLLVLYLRFRGKPRAETYAGVANALSRHVAPYMLDPSFSACRRQRDLVLTTLTELQSKIIVVANQTKQELAKAATLYPYINMCIDGSIKTEYTLPEFGNLTDQDRTTKQGTIQQALTFLMPTDPFTNEWNWSTAYQIGIHCIPMNFFDAKKGADYFKLFKTFSYMPSGATAIEGFQNPFAPILVPGPLQSADPGIGNGQVSILTEITDGDPCGIAVRKNLEAAKKAKVKVEELVRTTLAAIGSYPPETRATMIKNTQQVNFDIVLDLQKLQKKYPITDECAKAHVAEVTEWSTHMKDIARTGAILKNVS